MMKTQLTGSFQRIQEFLPEFDRVETPFYLYDLDLFEATLEEVRIQAARFGIRPHYAVKANHHPALLVKIAQSGFGADCVSGGELEHCLSIGFDAEKIVLAGVGKSEAEIELAIKENIAAINIESLQELELVGEIAGRYQKKARVALRINPNVEALTHSHISTGLASNKFGIASTELSACTRYLLKNSSIRFMGIHMHIGSQITQMEVFHKQAMSMNAYIEFFEKKGLICSTINAGGGLGINYEKPDTEPIASFSRYFQTLSNTIRRRSDQVLITEPGRSLVAQCGSLLTRVRYVKEGARLRFLIVDAGMNDLLRPALYGSYHKIENLSARPDIKHLEYEVVGPICESSDQFGKATSLPESKRNDLLAIRSSGAYGEVMASQYNLRKKAGSWFLSDDKLLFETDL